MQPHRLLTVLLTLLLFSAPLATIGEAQTQRSDDDFPTELNTNEKEPAIELLEHKGKSPFRQISRTRRKDSRDKLVQLCQEAVDTTARRMLSTEKHTPWQIMHALLGLREDFLILHDEVPVSGLDWVSAGQVFTNEYWFEKSKYGGRAHPYSVPYAFEGHANQFLAIMSMCGVGLDHTFGTSSGPVTMRQMIQHAQMTVSTKDEPTWTLWLLSRYLPPNARWRNEAGEAWSIEKLVQIQTGKPMQGAPCGGTHSLFALAHARNVYLRQGKPLRGVWMQAEWKIRKHINTARMQQNSNGTLSSNFFRGRKYDPDFNKRMASAGHVLEFLMIALPQKELNQLWVRRAIEATARDLMNNRKAFVKCSPLYHSVNALNIYLDRVNPKVKTQEMVSEPEDLRTAQAPQPARDATAQLKSVPFRGISRSRDGQKADADTADSAKVAISEEASQNQSALTAQPKPLKKTPAVPNSLTTELPSADKIKADSNGWKTTPRERRGAIIVPPEKENAEPSLPPLPRIPQNESDAATNGKPALLPEVAAEPMPSNDDALPTDSDGTSEADSAEPVDAINGSLFDLDAKPAAPTLEPAAPATSPAPSPPGNRRSVPVKSVSMPRPVPIVPFTESDRSVNSLPNPLSIPATEPQPAAEPAAEEPEKAVSTETTFAEPEAAVGEEFSDSKTTENESAGASVVEEDGETDVEADILAEPETVEPVVPTVTEPEAPIADSDQSETNEEPEPQATAATEPHNPSSKIPDGINNGFLDPDLDPKEWVSRFEIESREVFAGRKSILNAVGLKPGMSIADVGSGTGLYVGLFSQEVGPNGHVYAVDISPRLVDFVRRRVTSEGLDNVEVIQSEEKSTRLGDRKVDRVFVCDTYHHFEHYQLMLASIHDTLQPGGELILIDFDRIPGTSREWIVNHVRADKRTFRSEIEAAGFEFIEEVSIPEFKENYLLRFRKPAE